MSDLLELMQLAEETNKAIEASERNKLEPSFKESTCRYCKLADKEALKQGQRYCKSTYENVDGFCKNFF